MTYHSEEGLRTDTIEYDVLGRKIYETTGPDVVRMFYGPDGLILVRRFGRGPSFGVDSATYRYLADSLILYQTWVASGNSKKYEFDGDGKIQSVVSFEKERISPLTDSSAYVYQSGHLQEIQYYTHSGHKMELRSKTLLHYSGSRLDSMTQVSPVQRDFKTIYDSRQLPIETYYGKKLFLEYRYESR